MLSLFAQNELKVGRLYALYARKIAGMEKFWNRLVEEETRHASLLNKVKAELKGEAQDLFEENEYSQGIIGYISNFIDKEIDRARTKKISSEYAISCALRLEQSMVEEKCFEMFNPKVKKLKKVMEKLNKDTKRHAEELRKEMGRAHDGKK